MRDRNYFFQDSGIVIDEQLNDFIDNNKSRFLKIANITSFSIDEIKLYQKMSKEFDFLVKIDSYKIVDDKVIFCMENINGTTLSDCIWNHAEGVKIFTEDEIFDLYNKILKWNIQLYEYSKQLRQELGTVGFHVPNMNKRYSQIFYHDDISISNIFVTKERRFVLLDPNSFYWLSENQYHCYLNRCLQEFLALFFPL